MSCATRIKALRKTKQFTQDSLAKQINVARSTVIAWEKGTFEPEGDNIRNLAVALNTSVGYLLGETDAPAGGRVAQSLPALQEPKDETTTSTRKCRGKIYVEGKALDTLARNLRDRLSIEFDETDEKTLADVKEVLYDCMRFYEDREVKRKLA